MGVVLDPMEDEYLRDLYARGIEEGKEVGIQEGYWKARSGCSAASCRNDLVHYLNGLNQKLRRLPPVNFIVGIHVLEVR